ncbi:MAG: SIMPL domain-containing protein [Dehalococcoidales bacterium]|nr:SIMPL domain-containing protein [Dehalococcoidales bacterium]MDZ4230618.1 SIMPL domain-containing protein [Dehalococcoidales bacterium]
MKKFGLLAIGLVTVLIIGGLAACAPGSSNVGGVAALNITSQQEGIWVSGEGKVTVIPDVAILSLGIDAQASSVAEAQDMASGAMNDVMAVLTGNGVAERDIQTQQFSIHRVTRWDNVKQEETVVGYRVTNIVTAKIRDTGSTGAIIDAVAQAGGDLTRIDNIAFSVDDPSAYYDEAREKAMAEAKAKAEQLAGLAGVTLGKATFISENIQSPPIYFRGDVMLEAAPAAPTPISPGETEVRLSVQVAYAIIR